MKHKATAATALLSHMLASAGTTAGTGTNTGSNKPMNDTQITTKVKAALTKDHDTKARNIHLKTINGVVSLSGTARSEAEKEKAEQDARSVQASQTCTMIWWCDNRVDESQ